MRDLGRRVYGESHGQEQWKMKWKLGDVLGGSGSMLSSVGLAGVALWHLEVIGIVTKPL